MLGLPGLGGRGDEHDRLRPARQPLFQGPVPPLGVGADHERLGRTLAGFEKVEQPLADRVGVGVGVARHHQDQDFPDGNWLAVHGEVERMNPVVDRGRREIRGLGIGEGSHARIAPGLSQASSADW